MQKNTIATIDYANLCYIDTDVIRTAFGFDGLGILLVTNVPNLEQLRSNVLPLARQFAELPEEIKKNFEHEASYYSFGWSHGKEKMEKNTPDTMKGSYYFNPEYDLPYGEEYALLYPLFCHPNIWPNELIPNFSHNVMSLSSLIMDTGRVILSACDNYINSVYPSHSVTKLYDIAGMSKVSKGRLLHYFPAESSNNHDTWCGAHNDHGFLTGLVSSMYLDKFGNKISAPDPNCGLYIKSRSGDLVKVNIPSNSIAFQIGESSCIYSGGLLQPTPHVVIAPNTSNSIGVTPCVTPCGLIPDKKCESFFSGVTRETMAVFMSAKWDTIMEPPLEANIDDIFKGSTEEFLPKNIPFLSTRWAKGMTYQEFSDKTYQAYYQ